MLYNALFNYKNLRLGLKATDSAGKEETASSEPPPEN